MGSGLELTKTVHRQYKKPKTTKCNEIQYFVSVCTTEREKKSARTQSKREMKKNESKSKHTANDHNRLNEVASKIPNSFST